MYGEVDSPSPLWFSGSALVKVAMLRHRIWAIKMSARLLSASDVSPLCKKWGTRSRRGEAVELRGKERRDERNEFPFWKSTQFSLTMDFPDGWFFSPQWPPPIAVLMELAFTNPTSEARSEAKNSQREKYKRSECPLTLQVFPGSLSRTEGHNQKWTRHPTMQSFYSLNFTSCLFLWRRLM